MHLDFGHCLSCWIDPRGEDQRLWEGPEAEQVVGTAERLEGGVVAVDGDDDVVGGEAVAIQFGELRPQQILAEREDLLTSGTTTEISMLMNSPLYGPPPGFSLPTFRDFSPRF